MKTAAKQSVNLSLREAAAELGVHHVTLKRWIDDGEGPLALIKRGPIRSTIRIRREDLERWRHRHSGGEKQKGRGVPC